MFDLFTNADGRAPRVDAARDLFLPGSSIVKNTAAGPEVYTLERFIATRSAMLSDGSLTGFREQELKASTEIEGDHAERVCTYMKSGSLNGSPFTTRGVKVMRLARTPAGWRLAALAWDDEPGA
jgi:ribosomal-protein-serine acetyltransferase